jgi:hypothetical protein
MKSFMQGVIVTGLLLVLGCGAPREAAPHADKAARNVAGAPEPESVPRKIIYTANVDVVVNDFEGAIEQMRGLVKDHKAYIAKSEVGGMPGVPRSGTWTIRVPVDRFEDFLKGVAALGEVRRNATDSEDITDKYYDLEARIKTDEAEETALRKLLEQAGNKDLILGLRQELRSLRGQIEQDKGQLQRWSKETQLATVSLSMHDRKDYVPPLSPRFTSTVGRTFEGSLDALVTFGKGLVLAVVAAAPWLVVFGAVALPVWAVWRRRRRGVLATAPVPAPGSGTPPTA